MPAPNPNNLTVPDFQPPWAGTPQGPLVAPGKYSVEMYVMVDGKMEQQGTKLDFMVNPDHEPEADYATVAAFQLKTSQLSRLTSSAGRQLREANNKLRYIKAALVNTSNVSSSLYESHADLSKRLFDLGTQLNGDRTRGNKDESTSPSIMSRIGGVVWGHWNTTQLPTETQKRSIALAESEFEEYLNKANTYFDDLRAYEEAIEKAGAPYTPGRGME